MPTSDASFVRMTVKLLGPQTIQRDEVYTASTLRFQVALRDETFNHVDDSTVVGISWRLVDLDTRSVIATGTAPALAQAIIIISPTDNRMTGGERGHRLLQVAASYNAADVCYGQVEFRVRQLK